jgi:hypothetical protein
MLNVVQFYSAECHSAECHAAECHSAECHSVECHSVECHSVERHSAECRLKFRGTWGARKLMGENLKVVWAEFSILS